MRQVSPLPAGGAGIQVPYGKSGKQQQSSPKDDASDADSDDEAEEAAAPQSAPPPGMGTRIDRTV
jgi:hypothetical protein